MAVKYIGVIKLPGEQGSIIYRDVNCWEVLPPGTDGEVLTTNGPNANPSWESELGPIDSIQFNPTYTPPAPSHSEGLVFYDGAKHALSYYNEEADVTVNIGRELLIRVYNNTVSTITNGSVVYPTGADVGTGLPTIDLAHCDDEIASKIVGVVTHDIEPSTIGYVTKFGEVGDIDTSAFTVGDIVYLSETPGEVVATKPTGGCFVTTIGVIQKVGLTDGVLIVDIIPSQLAVEVTNTNGFPSDQRSGTTLAFDNGTRTFTIAPTGSQFHYYVDGNKYIKTSSESVIITDVEGTHLIYYEAETLTALANPSDGQLDALIRTEALVAYIYWDATNSTQIYFGDERHGISMSPDTHSYLHFTRGAQYLQGLALNNLLVDQNGSIDAHAQFGVDAGFITDEDLITVNAEVSSTTGLKIYYNSGVSSYLRQATETGFSVLTDVTAGVGITGRLVWNEFVGGAWQLTTVTNGDYVLCHVFAINGYTGQPQTIAIVGQSTYGNRATAREGAEIEISDISASLPFEEFVALGTVIFQTRDTYANAVKARTVSTEDGFDYVDWRQAEIRPGLPASSHNNLANLELAGTGVTWGHIDDQIQTIDGEKTFIENVEIVDATDPQLRLTHTSGTIYSDFETDSLGNLYITPSGGDVYYSDISALEIGGTGTSRPVLLLRNSNDDANGAGLNFRKLSNSPADNDVLGIMNFFGRDSALNLINYGYFRFLSRDVLDGDEAGGFDLYLLQDGTFQNMLDIDCGRNGVGSGSIIWNNNGVDMDFIVEGDTDANLLFVDAGNDRIGIGTDSPNQKLDVYFNTGTQLRLTRSDLHHLDMTVESDGKVTLTPTGNTVTINANNLISQGDTGKVIVKDTGTEFSAFFEFHNTNARQWVIGPGFPNSANPNFSFAEYIDNVFQGVRLVIERGGEVGINTTLPRRKLEILDTANAQLRLSYTDNVVYSDFKLASDGDLRITQTGDGVVIGQDTASGARLDVRDNGTGNFSIVDFHVDDQALWAMRIFNDTFGTSNASAFRYFMFNSGIFQFLAPGDLNFNSGNNSSLGTGGMVLKGATQRLGIGTNLPGRILSVDKSGEPQFRISETAFTNYTDFEVNSSGELKIDPTGSLLEVDGDIKQTVHTDNVSNPPTDAELDTIFGTPATVGAGFTAYIDDNNADTNFYQIVSNGTSWWIFTGTKAV